MDEGVATQYYVPYRAFSLPVLCPVHYSPNYGIENGCSLAKLYVLELGSCAIFYHPWDMKLEGLV